MGKGALLSLLIPLFLLLSISPHNVTSSRILFYHNLATYSHRVPTYELALALAKAGHEVTMFSPYRPREPIERHPNLTDLTASSVEKTVADSMKADLDINFRLTKQIPRCLYVCYPMALDLCEKLLTSPEMKDFFKKTPTLDLIIMDHAMAECGAAIAYKYGAKHIYFSTNTYFPSEHDFLGGHAPESGSIPETELDPVKVPMSLLDKVYNWFMSLHFRYEQYKYMFELDKVVRKHLNLSGMPFMDDVARNHSLVFYTGDVITDYPRSQPPNVVNVAGIHCKNMSGAIPKDLENFISDKESEGFVYFSTGSVVISSLLPDHIKASLFASMASFPRLRFLWKWDGVVPKSAPKNIYFSKWFPQQEILGHPRIRGFVTQSGRPSTLEAVCHGVPMISFPVLGDQDAVANRMAMVGGAVTLEIGTVTEEEFTRAIKEVVYGGRMLTRAKELQRIFHDRPQSPLEAAVWWTEYVLRHKDTSHLRPAGFHQSWYERRLLDVHAFLFTLILGGISGLLALLLVTLKRVQKLVVGDKSREKLKQKDKKLK